MLSNSTFESKLKSDMLSNEERLRKVVEYIAHNHLELSQEKNRWLAHDYAKRAQACLDCLE